MWPDFGLFCTVPLFLCTRWQQTERQATARLMLETGGKNLDSPLSRLLFIWNFQYIFNKNIYQEHIMVWRSNKWPTFPVEPFNGCYPNLKYAIWFFSKTHLRRLWILGDGEKLLVNLAPSKRRPGAFPRFWRQLTGHTCLSAFPVTPSELFCRAKIKTLSYDDFLGPK